MAKIKYGPMIAQASGSIGGSVFSHNRFGPYIRLRAKPVTVENAYTIAVKNRMSTVSRLWQTLTTAQQTAWKVWAGSNPITDSLGEKRILSPSQAYIKLNNRILQMGGATIDLPPQVGPPDPLETLTVTYDLGAGTTNVAYTATPLAAGVHGWMWAAVLDSAGIEYVGNKWKLVAISPAAQASPIDWLTYVEARFGTVQVGQRVFFKLHTGDEATGLISGPLTSSGTVVST